MITNNYTNEQYHALDSISKSGLDLIAKSPAHFKSKARFIGSDTARIGSAAHAFILESGKGVIVAPDIPRRSNADKEAWDTWFIHNGATHPIATSKDPKLPADLWLPTFEQQTGLLVVTESERVAMSRMLESVNTTAGDLLSGGKAEQSILFDYMDVSCRVRPDYLSRDKHIIVDLKTTEDASERAFRQSCAKYRYHVQHAMYSTGYHVVNSVWPEFYFVVVEKKAPYLSTVYRLNEDAVSHGIYLMDRDIQTYKDCIEADDWPGYSNNLELSIPIWDAPEIIENYAELVA
ncbi:PD-(D/E)XK nuclease-like domain-containing protein [uncultured Paraglaciecola sp.]|uniref:PD-(D/E)XK nuclease-like domain-containing protein n=1 Tax=uncultured Paraglaciecola sp. TaxID=1765024 RepID=UPI00261C7685|nr:PD-(D/E)XK nuclease-like domain-containing protein [uncultured Paraglaciecola sp.]